MKKLKNIPSVIILSLWITIPAIAQQTAIPRIDKMPNIPPGYQLMDWKQVAIDYDNLVFDINKTGQYLPFTTISNEPGINFPEINNIRMQTFVGQRGTERAEGINVMPAVIGATLVGVDKTNHLGTNWVVKLKDFYNKKNGQDIYLNGYRDTTGKDWWYDVMPNVYFYQLYSLYPDADPDFREQVTTIADIHLDVLYKLGAHTEPWTPPYMNHRAFNLATGQPYSESVPEPETAGSIAWILYQAYLHTSDIRYKQGAQLALDFLQGWTKNPSYELQLPYGILTAARMNAEQGTNYDLDKFLNWTFSSGHGTLREWGTIVGNWNGYEMSGVIGEANDDGNDYAFIMNGFQHAAALAPVAKYQPQYARALGKWLLNLTSASRYFYPGQLPPEHQEPTALAWAKQNNVYCIPYEAMKQTWQGISPMDMGDANRFGWAATDLSLYSGSSIGYLASLIAPTNVEGILQIDLNKTDFTGNNTHPHYLYYNPYQKTETVELNLPAGTHKLYDAISKKVINPKATGTVNIPIPADNVVLIIIQPQ